MNSGRAVLILGVIAYHSARVFDSSQFYIKSPIQSDALASVVLFGTVVGMPLFFCFAGYSIWHSLRVRRTAKLISERVLRLLVPFVAGVVLLVPLQIYVGRRIGGENVSYLQSLAQFLDVHLVFQFPIPISGPWFEPAHLWFLGYLFGFTMLMLPVLIWLNRRPRLPVLGTRGAAIVWIAAFLGVAIAEGVLGTETWGGWNRWAYLVFLALGVAVAIQPQVGRLVAHGWKISFVCSIGLFVGVAVTGYQLQGHVEPLPTSMELAPLLWRIAKSITMVLLLMAVVGSLASRDTSKVPEGRAANPSRAFLSYLQPISLPVYIVHQTILVVLAFWIVQWSIPAPTQWLALVILTFALSIASVEIVSRNALGRLLLGLPRRNQVPHRTRPPVDEGQASHPNSSRSYPALLTPAQPPLTSAPAAKAR